MSNILETCEPTIDKDITHDFHAGRRAKRLTAKQVMVLEKSFQLDHKLATERKLCLAQKLNLKPRQVVVWFQNRRTRWKSKELERSYKALCKQYDALKSDYQDLMQEKDMLKTKVLKLKERLAAKSERTLQKEINNHKISPDQAVQKADQNDRMALNTSFEYQFGSQQLNVSREMCLSDAEANLNMIFANQMLNFSLDPHAVGAAAEDAIFSTTTLY